MGKEEKFVKWFSELSNKDVAIAGGKGASLAEMYNYKFPIPPGFVITAHAYKHFIEVTGLKDKIKEALEGLDIEDTKKLENTAKKIQIMIDDTELPEDIAKEVREAYDILDVNKESMAGAKAVALDILRRSKEVPFVAVRSSATTEDLADASFAGQQETFVNVKGNTELLKKVVSCFASLFTARAIYYRQKKGFAHEKSYLAVVVQKMVNSDKSGVIFSKNPVADDDDIVIEAVWGLGEGIVSGRIKPDHYEIDRNLDKLNLKECKISEKKVAIVRDSAGKTILVKLTEERAKQQVLNNYELKMLSQYALKLEEHYKKPQDIEFAISGGDIYIVQSRPITTKFVGAKRKLSGDILLSGLGASPGISSGVVKIVSGLEELDKIKKGDIMVTVMTNPDMVVAMQKAAGIITDEGGVTSHAAIVSREMGIPAVVGTEEATKKLRDGQEVTVDGNAGKVYDGKGETKLAEIKPIVHTKTKIKVIVDLPDYAERAALSGCAAVGLTRLEGIIAEGGKHPLYFVQHKKTEEYEKLIAHGLKKLCAPFKEVWVRTSDIRSDEFRNLEGAPKDIEGNPMLGDHGIRFSVKHRDILIAELRAVKSVAEHHKDKIIGIMMPQVISVDEVRTVKEEAAKLGMPENVKIGIMVETPAAVQVINELCEEGIKFASFGTNDLTQYILAIDRNNEHVQYLFNEMNPAVLSAISYVIRRCKRYGVETSICGQAGSREEMAKFLVAEGIDSISVNADAALKVSEIVASIERQREERKQTFEGSSAQAQLIRGKKNSAGDRNMKLDLVDEDRKLPSSMKYTAEQPNFEEELKMMALNGMNDVKAKSAEKDIEEIILKELEKDAYEPGLDGKKKENKEMPPLNDAIPVSSEHFEEKKEDREVVVG